MSDSTTRGGWVYFIQHGGPSGHIKIGTTTANPFARMRSLQTGAPEELRLLAAMPGDARVEHELHERFAALRLRAGGEWFRASPELLGFVAGVYWARRDEQPQDDGEFEPTPADYARAGAAAFFVWWAVTEANGGYENGRLPDPIVRALVHAEAAIEEMVNEGGTALAFEEIVGSNSAATSQDALNSIRVHLDAAKNESGQQH